MRAGGPEDAGILGCLDARGPLPNLQGPATEEDLDACTELSSKVHGHHRGPGLLGAMRQGTATTVEHTGRVTGHTTTVGLFGHTVGETNEDLKALIGAAPEFPGPGFLLPTRNAGVLRWCLQRGPRIVQPMTLVSMGPYDEPAGASMTSVMY